MRQVAYSKPSYGDRSGILFISTSWLWYSNLRPHNGFRPGAYSQVLIHMLQVLLYRTGTDPELQRDFFIGEPLSQPS